MNALTMIWLVIGVGIIAAVLIIKKKRSDESAGD